MSFRLKTSMWPLLLIYFAFLTPMSRTAIVIDPTTSTTIALAADFSSSTDFYLLVITDRSVVLGSTFSFYSQSSSNPRIIFAKLFNSDTTTSGSLTRTPLSLPTLGTITYHYLKAKQDNSNPFTISASTTAFVNRFSGAGDSFTASTRDITTLGDLSQYQSIVYTTYVGHSNPWDVVCDYEIQYTGVIRGVFFNDDNKMNWQGSNLNYNTPITKTFQSITLEPSNLVVITILGRQLTVNSFTFTNCKVLGFPVTTSSIGLKFYYQTAIAKTSDDATYTATTITCPTYSTRCSSSSFSIRCDSTQVRYNGVCQSKCPTASPNVNRLGDCVSQTPLEYEIGAHTVTAAADSFTVQLNIDAPASTKFLVMLTPNVLPSYSVPLLSNTYTTDPPFQTSQAFTYTYPGGVQTISKSGLKPTGLGGSIAYTLGFHLFEIVTALNRTMLVKTYASNPQNSETALAAYEQFYYAKYTDPQALLSTKFISIETFLECTIPCTISVYANGLLKIYENLQVLLASANLGTTPWSFPLSKSFTGVVGLSFRLEQSSTFRLDVQGSGFTVFTNSFFRMRFPITLNGGASFPCTKSNCLSCEGSTCYSCQDGYFLDPSTASCVTTCPTTTGAPGFKNVLEKKCIYSCPTGLSLINNDYCYYECPQPAKYYIDPSGCTGDCALGCQTCRNASVCLACYPGTTQQSNGDCKCNTLGTFFVRADGACTGQCSWNCEYCQQDSVCLQCSSNTVAVGGICTCPSPKIPYGNDCLCPIGYTENPSTHACELNTYLEVDYPSTASISNSLVLQARINPAEEAIFTPVFTWTVTSTSANPTLVNSMNSNLLSQRTKTLIIPSGLLENGVTYTFTAKYTNSLGNHLTKTFNVVGTNQVYPQVIINGGLSQTFTRSEPVVLQAEILPSSWPYSTSPLEVTWTKTQGDPIALSTYLNPLNQLQLSIPFCKVKPEQIYKFQASVSLGSASVPFTVLETQVLIPAQLELALQNPNQNHVIDDDLVLESTLSVKDTCGDTVPDDFVDTNALHYIWTCQLVDSSNTYSACPDPSNLFKVVRSTSTLTIPSSYFTSYAGFEFIISVQTTVEFNSQTVSSGQVKSLTAQSSFTIVASGDIRLGLSCVNNTGCIVSNSNPANLITADILTGTSHQPVYDWTLSIPGSHLSFLSTLKILSNPLPSTTDQFLRVALTVTDSGYQGAAYLQLPINQSPTGGALSVFPTSGYSLSTDFFISTTGWKDDDFPLSYSFSYTYSSTGTFKSLSSNQRGNYISTQLLGKPAQTTLYLKVVVTDKFGAFSSATTTVVVQQSETSIVGVGVKAENFLDSISSFDSSYNFQQSGFYLQELANWEQITLTQAASSTCPTCSSHGTCGTSGHCTCDTGYALPDCSIALTDIETIKQLKIDLLKEASNAYNVTQDPEMRQELFETMVTMSQNEEFNDQNTFKEIQAVIESLDIEDAILNDEESRELAELLNNMLFYASATDCDIRSQFTKDLEGITYQYLTIIGKNTLEEKIPGQDAFVNADDIFDIYTQKLTLCSAPDVTIYTSDEAYSVKLFTESAIPPEQCVKEIGVQYVAFSRRLFNCRSNVRLLEEAGKDKSKAAVEVTETSTGSEVDVVGVILIGTTATCGTGCEIIRNSQGGCKCSSTTGFDLRERIAEIFTKSRLDTVTHIDALKEFSWGNVAFWTVIALTVWFVASVYAVKFKVQDYCMLERFKQSAKTKAAKARLLILVTHPMFGSYLYNDPYISKITRIILYYTRIVLLLTYASLFADITFKEDFGFTVMIVLLNYLTVIPLYLLLHYLLEVNRESSKYNSGGLFKQYKRYLGVILTSAVLMGCALIILIVSVQFSSDQQAGWTVSFIVSLVQDLFVSPVLAMLLEIMLLKAYQRCLETNSTFCAKILSKITDKKIRRIYAIIFPVKVTKVDASPKIQLKNQLKNVFRIVPLNQQGTLRRDSTPRTGSMGGFSDANTPNTPHMVPITRQDSYQDSGFLSTKARDAKFYGDQEQEYLKSSISTNRNALYRGFSSPKSDEGEEKTVRESFKSIPEKSPTGAKEVEFRSTEYKSDRPSLTALDFSRLVGNSDSESEQPVVHFSNGRKFLERKGSKNISNSGRVSSELQRINSGVLAPLDEVTEEASPQVRIRPNILLGLERKSSFDTKGDAGKIVYTAGNGRRTVLVKKSTLNKRYGVGDFEQTLMKIRASPPGRREERIEEEEGESMEKEAERSLQVEEI